MKVAPTTSARGSWRRGSATSTTSSAAWTLPVSSVMMTSIAESLDCRPGGDRRDSTVR